MREVTMDAAATEQWGEGLVAVPAGEPVEVEVRLESVHEGILITADIATQYTGVCSRCLIDITRPLQVEFQELFGYPGEEAVDFEVQHDHVDLELPVRDSIVLSLPFQPVCQPDCPGLDPNTGERLAPEAAQESHDPIDPRWATLTAYTPDPDDQAMSPGADNTEKS